ncbi:hypothetical protein PMAYCL1PPCAC_00107, partial [Pristionchus mayeri]
LFTQVASLSHEILDWPMHRSMMGSSHRSPLYPSSRIFHDCISQKHMVGVPRSSIQSTLTRHICTLRSRSSS